MSISSDFWKAMNQSGVQISGSNNSGKKTSGGSTATGIAPVVTSSSKKKKKFKSLSDEFWEGVGNGEVYIAPIGSQTGSSVASRVQARASGGKKDKDDDKPLDFFQKGAFEDGFDWSDIPKVILGTAADAGLGLVKGAGGIAEGLVDLVDYGIAGVADLAGADGYADDLRKATQENLVEKFTQGATDYLDQYSVLGRTSDAILQGIGQVGTIVATGGLGASAGLSGAGVSALTTGVMGLSGVGSGMGEAYQGGAIDEEAVKYGLISGASDALTELMFGGMGKAVNALGFSRGLSSADDMLAKAVSGKFKNQIAKNFAEYGVKASAEGVEEVVAGVAQAMGKKLTYMSEEEMKDILGDENLLEQFIVGMVTSGMIQSGIVPGTKDGSLVEANKAGKDFITGQTQNEKAVIDKLVADRIAEREQKGDTLSKRDKSDIEEAVIRELEKGYISIDTIEEVLGGDSYKNYKKTLEAEDAQIEDLEKQLKELEGAPNTVGNSKKYDALQAKLETMKKRNKSNDLKSRLEKEVFELAKGDRLVESYNERERAKQDFVAEYDKFKGSKFEDAAKKTLDNATKAGANNTHRVRDFVEFVAKTSGDTGLSFDFKSGEQIKTDFIERQTAEIQKLEKSIEQLKSNPKQKGKNAKLIAEHQQKIAKLQDLLTKVKSGETKVNGNITDNGIVLNLDSEKPLNRIIGHEVTHSFETAKNYDALRETLYSYAKSKGVDIDVEIESRKLMYEGVKGADAEAELVADLVGDYLFSDQDYITNLSTQNQNVFQKLWDEVKHLCKLATAGSKEARELERVRKAFEDAYREGGKTQGDTKHSLSGSDGEVTDAQNEQGLNREEEVSYSLSKDTEYMDKAIAMNASSFHVDSKTLEETKALRERIATRMNDIKDKGLVGLPEDIEGNTYIANSSYDGTEENTTICPRSLASEAFVDAVSEYLGRPLTVEEQIYISQDLQGRSLTPECTYCYVATDRKAYRAFLGEYVSQRDAVLQKVKDNPNADVSRSGELYKEFLNGRKDTNPMYSRFKMWVDAYKNGKPMIDASHLANINKLMGDINSEFGAELKPQITDAMKYAQSASWAKKRVNYVAYNGHILKWKQDRINKLNSHYGLRMYSFSDFHPAFVLENMQMITDASVRGLKMLGYTKDTDFVEIFAPSGMNINISTFGFETSGEVFENNLIGAGWEKAKALREQYPNVGITFVATNDTLVNWALDQDWIDVVIPFHLVRTGREVAKAFNYHDYTSESSDMKTKDWKKGDKKYIAPTEHNNDKATYLTALEKNHLKPRFERFIENPNYMKLVNECRQPASVSKPVQPTFNEDAAMVTLAKLEANGYYQPIGGSVDRMYEIAGEVAEAMTQQIAPNYSMSNANEQFAPDSDFDFYGRDFAKQEDDIAPVAENATTQESPIYESNDKSAPEGQTTMFEPVEEKKTTRKEYHQSIIDNIKARFAEKGFDLDKVLKNAKNLSTWSTVDNTPQRVMEKALGYKEGGILADITVNQVAQNETEGIKWINKNVELLKQISKDYNIKPGSKESAAAQMYAEGFFVNENNEIIRYGDPELAQDFKDPKVRQNIKRLARDPRIRKIYDDALASINESRTRNLYPEIPKLDNYFLHFRAMNDTFSTLGLPFNPNDIRAKDLPTDLNGVTADLKPGQPYFASANHRRGKRTSFDMLGGIERYLTSAKNQIYHIDDIQTLRALRNYIAETYGQATGLEDLDSLTDAEAEDRIQQVYGSHLSTFAKFLNEEANVLAGKTALIDRGIEGVIGRRGITFLNTLNKQVGSNMVGYNVSSSLTNFLPVAQTFAKTNKFDFVKAFAQTVANKVSRGKFDTFSQDSPVVIRRKGEDRFYRTPWQKVADPGYALMGMVDDISTEIIARTKYNEFTRKGMDSQKAHFETDKWVSKLMSDRSLGQQPQLYNSKMLGLVTKFQLEVRNQLDAQFYDTVQETKVSNEQIQNGLARNAKTAAQVASTFTQLAVAQHLFGMAFESVAGYNPAFDIIEVLMTAFGFDDEEDSEDTALDNIEQGFLALLEDMPYASTFLDGGRIPISDALPINELVQGKDQYGNDKSRWKTAAEVAPYYFMPGGYGQAKKTTAGLKMFSDDHPIAGSYTDAGNLRFPVEDTLKNRVHAGIFGQYANENARKYFDEEQRTLNPEQTEIFAGLDMPIEDYWEYRDNLYEFYDVRDALKEASFADDATDEDVLKYAYINNVYSGIYDRFDQQKEIASGNSSLKKSQLRDLQSQMEKMLSESKYALDNIKIYGAYGEVGSKRYNKDTDSGKWYEIKPKNADGSDNWYYQKEQEVTEGLGISYEEYWNNREEYNYAYDKPGRYAIAKAIGGYDSYMEHYDVLENWQSDSYLGADKDSNGNSISGSRKKKVIEYIDGLDADYGEKLILYRTVYSSKADKKAYNMEIVNYLNSRDDISYEEKKSILEELEMEVDDEGYISW